VHQHLGLALVLSGLGGCTGELSRATDGATSPSDNSALAESGATKAVADSSALSQEQRCDVAGPDAGPAVAVRLSQEEYRNTAFDLLGMGSPDVAGFLLPEDVSGFVGASTQLTSATELIAYEQAAAELAASALELLPELSGTLENEETVMSFLDDFGSRALRHPLSEQEVDDYMRVYRTAKELDTPRGGVEWMLRALLSSPTFIYRVERAASPQNDGDSQAPLSSFERAARLSYIFAASPPDEELQAAAEAGKLETPEQLRAHAQRLMQSDRGRKQMQRFFLEWLEVETPHNAQLILFDGIDPENANIRNEVIESLSGLLAQVLWEDVGSLQDLLTFPGLPVNASLAHSLDIEGTYPQDSMSIATNDARVGVLTHPAVLASHGTEGFARATHRGAFIMKRLLCEEAPAPPADVLAVFPELTENELLPTARATLEELHQVPGCQVCHTVIDGFGYPFENYDAQGLYQTHEEWGTSGPAPVDASGSIELDGESQSYENAAEFAAILADSDKVRACVTKQWMTFALRRTVEETEGDACSVNAMGKAFGSESDLTDSLLSVVSTDAFMNRRTEISANE